MRRNIVSAVVLFLLISIPGIPQTSNAQLSGVVTDQSGALIPGVTITMTKADTGVVTTTVSRTTFSRFVASVSLSRKSKAKTFIASSGPMELSRARSLFPLRWIPISSTPVTKMAC